MAGADLGERLPYAELHCHSNFSFLDGASEPEALVEEAAPLRLDSIAITDHDGMDAGEPSVSLRGALEWSMRQLDADTAATFVELSTQHPAGISALQPAGAVNRDPIEVRKHLHTLANHQLLTSEPMAPTKRTRSSASTPPN